MFNESTRFKLAVGMLLLYLVEGLMKALVNGFPIEVVIGAQGVIATFYFTVRTINDVKLAKYGCGDQNGGPK